MLVTNEFLEVPDDTDQFNRTGVISVPTSILTGTAEPIIVPSGVFCGDEPRSQREAEHRAAQWAEYYLNYIATGSSGG